jgi:hypothetical protein
LVWSVQAVEAEGIVVVGVVLVGIIVVGVAVGVGIVVEVVGAEVLTRSLGPGFVRAGGVGPTPDAQFEGCT